MKGLAGSLPLLLLWVLPLVSGLLMALAGADLTSWRALLAHPQAFTALLLSLANGPGKHRCIGAGRACDRSRPLWHAGLGSTAVPCRCHACVPHLAFAIGFGLLVMPSGAAGPASCGRPDSTPMDDCTGPAWPEPCRCLGPQGNSISPRHDLGRAGRGDSAVALSGQWRAARSLGHGPGSVWLGVIQPSSCSGWPGLWRRCWPMAALSSTWPWCWGRPSRRRLPSSSGAISTMPRRRSMAGARWRLLLTLGVAGLFVIAAVICG